MAVDTRARASNRNRTQIAEERDARVPLRGKMGTGENGGGKVSHGSGGIVPLPAE
jgi:hypothetical protein